MRRKHTHHKDGESCRAGKVLDLYNIWGSSTILLEIFTDKNGAVNIFTPHAQHERGKVMGVGVHIYIYIYMFICLRK